MESNKIKAKPKPKIIQKSLDEYYFERLQEHAKKFQPIFDATVFTPAIETKKALGEIACLDSQLIKERVKWSQDKKVLDTRWNDAVTRYNDIYQNIPKFNGYYKDSFAKRERALESYEREKEQCNNKDRDIRRLQREVQRLQDIKESTNNRLSKFGVFKTYLSKVKESSAGEYTDVRDIIDRYTILSDARANLSDRNDHTRDTIIKRQRALDGDMLTKSNEVLAYRNYLSELLEYHDSLKEQVQALDDNLIRIKTTAAQRTMIIGQIKMAIQNLYHQVCKNMHRAAKLAPQDVLGQLADIRISVREMFKLNKDIKHMLKAAAAAAEADKIAKEKAAKKLEERQKRIDKLTKRGNLDVREVFGLPHLNLEPSGKTDFKKMLANHKVATEANLKSKDVID